MPVKTVVNTVHEKCNKENLRLIAEHTAQRPEEHFDMSYFVKHDNYSFGFAASEDVVQQIKNPCGTIACVLGDCPQIGGAFTPDGTENWEGYSERVTGIPLETSDWEYLFSGRWGDDDYDRPAPDNTAAGAAKRILHYIKYGLPDDWNKQMTGEADLDYMEEE